MSTSNARINGFAAGYNLASTTADVLATAGSGTKAVVTNTKDVTLGFFGGVRYAIAERRAPALPKQVRDKDAEMRAKRELYERAHNGSRPTVILLGTQ